LQTKIVLINPMKKRVKMLINKKKEMDESLMKMAKMARSSSNCLKKQLGCALLTADGQIFLGWNGPPRVIKTCFPECPRMKVAGIQTLHLCRAVHAERRALLHASRKGVATQGSTLYSYMGLPCKDCLIELISGGVTRIVCENDIVYDELSKIIMHEWIEAGGKFEILSMGGTPTHAGTHFYENVWFRPIRW